MKTTETYGRQSAKKSENHTDSTGKMNTYVTYEISMMVPFIRDKTMLKYVSDICIVLIQEGQTRH
jgi:hypothetical protein